MASAFGPSFEHLANKSIIWLHNRTLITKMLKLPSRNPETGQCLTEKASEPKDLIIIKHNLTPNAELASAGRDTSTSVFA